jgi:predicted nucleic acid-binding protein
VHFAAAHTRFLCYYNSREYELDKGCHSVYALQFHLVKCVKYRKRILTGLFDDRLKEIMKGKRIHDANIAATMIANGVSILFTLNVEDFKTFKEIRLISARY